MSCKENDKLTDLLADAFDEAFENDMELRQALIKKFRSDDPDHYYHCEYGRLDFLAVFYDMVYEKIEEAFFNRDGKYPNFNIRDLACEVYGLKL